jgi:WD40 repeat protein
MSLPDVTNADQVFLPSLPTFPYVGLRPFEQTEWPIFFGRERMTEEVIRRILVDRLVFLHGASGDGKSSLVRAGVLARLAQTHVRSGLRWHTCTMRPGSNPLANLADAIASVDQRTKNPSLVYLRALNQGRDASQEIARLLSLDEETRLCILLDQFEEIFRFAVEGNRDEASLFIDFLVGFAKQPPTGMYVIATMRSEFLADCALFEGLADVINSSQYLLPRMTTTEYLRAICEPAALYGGAVTHHLAERLIVDAQKGNDGLPLIQHALNQLWHFESNAHVEAKPVLDLALYNELGPLGRLLSNHADSVADATGADTVVIEELFRALTDINAQGKAVRRPQTFGSLVAVTNTTEDKLRKILDAFRKPGVSFITPYEPIAIQTDTNVDISHEALIRRWHRIADHPHGWLQNEFRDGLTWRTLIAQAEQFQSNSENVLPEGTAQARNAWIKSRNEAWAHRYGGRWDDVNRLIKVSLEQAEARTRERLRQESEKLRLVTYEGLYKKQSRTVKWLAVSASLAAIAFGSFVGLGLWGAQQQKQQQLVLQQQLLYNKLTNLQNQITDSRTKAKTKAAYYFELQRDAQRGGRAVAPKGLTVVEIMNAIHADAVQVKTAVPADETVDPAIKEANSRKAEAFQTWDELQSKIRGLAANRSQTIAVIQKGNTTLWDKVSAAEQNQITERVRSAVSGIGEHNQQRKLRVALYATAAIPENIKTINGMLGDAIVQFRQQDNFLPPGASQVWALATNPGNQHEVAIGDDNGIVWLLNSDLKAVDNNRFGGDATFNRIPALTVSNGVVNSLAFSADGKFLAAAYRTSGVAVWESGAGSPRCALKPIGNGGAYGVAFIGTSVVAAGDRGIYKLDLSSNCAQSKIIDRSEPIYGVAADREGKLLAAAGGDGSVMVWSLDSPGVPIPIFNFRASQPMFAVTFSPGGRKLAATGAQGIGYVWTVQDMKLGDLQTLSSENGTTVGQVAFGNTPAGADDQFIIATASANGSGIVHQLDGYKTIEVDDGAGLFGVAFVVSSSDRLQLLTTNLNGRAGLWRITGDDHLARDREHLLRTGAKRIASLALDKEDCKVLRELQIPIFVDMEKKNFESDDVCPFYYLGDY